MFILALFVFFFDTKLCEMNGAGGWFTAHRSHPTFWRLDIGIGGNKVLRNPQGCDEDMARRMFSQTHDTKVAKARMFFMREAKATRV